MRPLATTFTKSGWNHEQIFRDGNIAIYRRWKDAGLPPHFETIRIDSHNGYEIGGKWIEPAESYPSEKSWGLYGFTFPTEAESRAKADLLITARKTASDAKLAPMGEQQTTV